MPAPLGLLTEPSNSSSSSSLSPPKIICVTRCYSFWHPCSEYFFYWGALMEPWHLPSLAKAVLHKDLTPWLTSHHGTLITCYPPSQLYHTFSQAYASKSPFCDFHCQSGSYFNTPQFALYLHVTLHPEIKRSLLGIQSCIYSWIPYLSCFPSCCFYSIPVGQRLQMASHAWIIYRSGAMDTSNCTRWITTKTNSSVYNWLGMQHKKPCQTKQ